MSQEEGSDGLGARDILWAVIEGTCLDGLLMESTVRTEFDGKIYSNTFRLRTSPKPKAASGKQAEKAQASTTRTVRTLVRSTDPSESRRLLTSQSLRSEETKRDVEQVYSWVGTRGSQPGRVWPFDPFLSFLSRTAITLFDFVLPVWKDFDVFGGGPASADPNASVLDLSFSRPPGGRSDLLPYRIRLWVKKEKDSPSGPERWHQVRIEHYHNDRLARTLTPADWVLLRDDRGNVRGWVATRWRFENLGGRATERVVSELLVTRLEVDEKISSFLFTREYMGTDW